MRQTPDTILVVSLEATCWETPLEQPPKQHNEVIELAWLPLSFQKLTTGNPVSFFVKPPTSKVSEFCTRITGVKQAQVDKGFSLIDACQKLVNAGSQKLPWASFGDFDRFIFKHQCNTNKVPYPFQIGHWDFATIFAKMMGLEHEVKLPIALKLMGLDFIGERHNSRDEVNNIAALMVETFRRVRGNYATTKITTDRTTEEPGTKETEE
jgi:inhibitor of KinA sporulation pathway (predicted exonuclease)